MKKGSKLAIGIILFTITFIGGCIFLMRGCLSAHDTYSQFDEAQGFKNEKGNVIVFLKELYKVTSYSSGGGMTHINGYPIYYLETRDVSSLKLLKSTEFEEKENPLMTTPHIIGRDDKIIWIFQGKIMAFDVFSHELVCTKEKLEQQNSVLKDNLPDDIQYYKYNYILGRMEITTKNALHFHISNLFNAQKIDENIDKDPEDISELKSIKEKLITDRSEMGKNLANKNYDDYYKLYDSIQKIEAQISKKSDELKNNKEFNQKIQESRAEGFNYFYDRLGNAVILDSTIYALLSNKDLSENNGNFYFRRIYSEDVQRSIYQATYKDMYTSSGFPSNCKVSDWKLVNNSISFLKGGFLENKDNLKPIQLSDPSGWLIVSAKEVGNKSKLILQRVNKQGIVIWTTELPIINFSDMVLSGDYLILFSNDGEKITGSDKCNWIISINLKKGEYTLFDLGKEE